MGVGLNFFSDLSGIASKRLRAGWLRRLWLRYRVKILLEV
jgi:hypothetical protein